MVKILKQDSELHQKIDQVFQLMHDLGISFDYCNYYGVHVRCGDLSFLMKEEVGGITTSIPPEIEYRFVLEEREFSDV